MTEKKITDDLLEELEQLETSSEELEAQTENTRRKQQEYQEMGSAENLDATAVMLEAAKTAQEAASQSQKAAETSIKHANKQKEQIMELSDANFAWRQAVKSANNEIKSAKSRFSIMLSATVVTSVVTVSALGWMLYNMQQKEAQYKGEVLDILQTENGLLSKEITIKVDELASLIELLSADIQKFSRGAVTASVMPEPVPTPSPAIEDASAPPVDEETAAEMSTKDMPFETRPVNAESLAELKALIEQVLEQQSKLQAKTLSRPQMAASGGLTAEQEKQLKGIGWLIRKQSKTLKEIQATLGDHGTVTSNGGTEKSYQAIQKSLSEMKAQLNNLKSQQSELQSQVHKLQKETEKLAADQPYRYQIQK